MKRRHRRETSDELDRLFAAEQEAEVADGGFTRRVVARLEPLPPSKNSYRIPTLATAFVSILLVIWVSVSGFDLGGVAERCRGFDGEVAGLRLVPRQWSIPREPAATDERGSFAGSSPTGGVHVR